MSLAVEEALRRSKQQRGQWVRLGVNLVTGIWTFACPKCWARFSLVTQPQMPDTCPKCGEAIQPPAPIEAP